MPLNASNPAQITCPNCGHSFEPTAAMEQTMRERLSNEYNRKWTEQKQKQDAEFALRETALQQSLEQLESQRRSLDTELNKRLEVESQKVRQELEKDLRQQAEQKVAARLNFLEEQSKSTQEQLRESQQKELEFLRKEEALRQREESMEIEKQRAFAAERTRLQEELQHAEEERTRLREEQNTLRFREYEKQLSDQKKLIEEMKRKSEQGSMQLQGEVQELELEDMLRTAFPFDEVLEVPKGKRGADCLLKVRNNFGQECGIIVIESKRTQNFGSDWIEKLKADMLICRAEIAVIVTQTFPKDMDRFGERQGVYICSIAEAKSLLAVLRNALLKLFEVRKSQENKGDKMVALYDYLTSSEFMAPWNTMRESFQNFRNQLQKERDDFEKNWKKKEKMLDMIIKNSLQISGSIEGISGIESMNWNASVALGNEPGLLTE
ncbi:MAG: DUF2130 domain-containing protein [Bacteroidetes bacterium]|nr:DUF2130 domain-containing protein [Bacteroidota bacterium]